MEPANAFRHEWKKLTEDDREKLIPEMLLSLPGWRWWASDRQGMVLYLGHIFEEAQQPFLEEMAVSDKGRAGRRVHA